MNNSSKQMSPMTFVLGFLIALALAVFYLFSTDSGRLNNAYEDIMQIESISSTTQRQINLANSGAHMERDVYIIGQLTTNSLTSGGDTTISLFQDANIALLATQVVEEWLTIEEILSVNWNQPDDHVNVDLDFNSLGLARDRHFKAMTDLSMGISEHTELLNENISQYQLAILVLLFVISMIMINHVLQTRAELIISREMATNAQIDTATGLYNRSRCQELFKSNQAISDQRRPAIMVLDLNDLKKTNDTLGHRVGDELIYNFALILKNACAVHNIAPFIGRYGGDEFVVYYEDVKNEEELVLYLKELEFLTKEQNEKETRYQVSYAVGYSFISNASEEKLTARQLFDKADAAMYVNKIEGKRAKNPNYDEEAAKGEVR